MMRVVCPCCRASNESGPACRRCKADLTLLFQLEEQREQLLRQTRAHLLDSDPVHALATLNQADAIRADRDSRQLRSLANLLLGDFSTALADYRAVIAASSGRS